MTDRRERVEQAIYERITKLYPHRNEISTDIAIASDIATVALTALADDLLPEGFDPDYIEAERGEYGQRVFFAGPPYEATTGVATEREGTGRTIPTAIRNALNGGEQ